MAKLYFRYGAMGSSKSANALMVRYNYLERGKNVLLMKPSTDTRDGVHRILSRCGLEAECTLVEDMDLKAVEAGKMVFGKRFASGIDSSKDHAQLLPATLVLKVATEFAPATTCV